MVAELRSMDLVTRTDGAPRSKAQLRFQQLIKRVAQLKRVLQDWSIAEPGLHRGIAEYQAHRAQHNAALADLVRMLDRMYSAPGLNKRERSLLRDLLAQLAGELAGEPGNDDIKAIYNAHSHGDYDAEVAATDASRVEFMKVVLAHELDMDFDDDVASLEDLQRAAERRREELDREAAERDAAREARRAKRKKSARQIAAEARRATETSQLGKSLQEVYRKLVLLLHPDHEQDPDERTRKTLLMQEVNVAYDRKDLLALLELRLRFEQIDPDRASTIAEDRLQHYNTLLAEQVRQLQQELSAVEAPWRDQLELRRISPSIVRAHLDLDLRDLLDAIAAIRTDLARLADLAELKLWLRAAQRTSTRR